MFERIEEHFEHGYRKRTVYETDLGVRYGPWLDNDNKPTTPPFTGGGLKHDRESRIVSKSCLACGRYNTCLVDDHISSQCYTGTGQSRASSGQREALIFIPPDYLVLTEAGWIDTRQSPGAYGIYD